MNIDENRLTELEQTVTHQDQQIQDLSDMVGRQWQEIDLLKKHLSRTEQKLEDLQNQPEGGDITHERPPHY